MKSRFFVDKKLLKKIEKDLKKRRFIEEQIKDDLNRFNEQIDDDTVLNIFRHIKEHGNKRQRNDLIGIEERYREFNLQPEDTLRIVDWYELMCDFDNNK